MRKSSSILAITCAAVLAAASAGPAVAADKKLSATVFGQVSKYSGQDALGVVFGQVGYLFTDRIEGGVQISQVLGGVESTGLGVFGKYYFGGVAQAKTWLPYAHAAVFRNSGSGADSTSLRAGGGIDFPLSEAAALTAEAAFSRQQFSGAGSRSVNGTEVLVGVKFRF